jgi:hypothetical protein
MHYDGAACHQAKSVNPFNAASTKRCISVLNRCLVSRAVLLPMSALCLQDIYAAMCAGLAVSGSNGQPEDSAAVSDAAEAVLAGVLGHAGVEAPADSNHTTSSSLLPQPQLLEVRGFSSAVMARLKCGCVHGFTALALVVGSKLKSA